jgi:lysozyme family protein
MSWENDHNFVRAVNVILKHEGDFSEDPDDPGNWTGGVKGVGELAGTRWGISAAAYPHLDIKGLRLDGAKGIYYRDYWQKYGAGQMPAKLALCYFDACVNQGPQQAALALQRALGVKTDGVVGPVTISAARAADQAVSVPRLMAERAYQYSGTKNFQKYGRGWFSRLFGVMQETVTL